MALRSKPGGDEAMRHVHGVERAVTLLQEFLTVYQDEGPIAFGRS
jgi:hypothetical protein